MGLDPVSLTALAIAKATELATAATAALAPAAAPAAAGGAQALSPAALVTLEQTGQHAALQSLIASGVSNPAAAATQIGTSAAAGAAGGASAAQRIGAGAATASAAAGGAQTLKSTPSTSVNLPTKGTEDRSAAVAAERDRRRQAARGRASTILSTPLGTPGPANVGVRTLLGG